MKKLTIRWNGSETDNLKITQNLDKNEITIEVLDDADSPTIQMSVDEFYYSLHFLMQEPQTFFVDYFFPNAIDNYGNKVKLEDVHYSIVNLAENIENYGFSMIHLDNGDGQHEITYLRSLWHMHFESPQNQYNQFISEHLQYGDYQEELEQSSELPLISIPYIFDDIS